MGQILSTRNVHNDSVVGQVPEQGSFTTQEDQSLKDADQLLQQDSITKQAEQSKDNDNSRSKEASKKFLDLWPELTVRIAAHAQFDHQEGQKGDTRDDEIAVLWKTFENMPDDTRAKANERGLSLEKMVDHEDGNPIIHIVHYIGPKAGCKITATKLHPIFQVCQRLRREGDDFIRGIHFQVNLQDQKRFRSAIRDALIAISKEIEHLPMLRYLKIAFYNTDEGHRRAQQDYMSSAERIHRVNTKEVGDLYSTILCNWTKMPWVDREVRGGGYLTPDSWLSFVYELRDENIAGALLHVQSWRAGFEEKVYQS